MLQEIRNDLPPRFNVQNRFTEANNEDLRGEIERNLPLAVWQTSKFSKRFAGSDRTETAFNVHRFVRENFLYLKDSPQVQKIQLPSEYLHSLSGDCKSVSLFIASIFLNLKYPTFFKYASYSNSPTPTHIYVQIEDETGKLITIDGTSKQFDNELTPNHYILKPLNMRIQTLSDNMDVLADQILADQLAPQAASVFLNRLEAMPSNDRANYLKQFTNENRSKLFKAIQSVDKLASLQDVPMTKLNPGLFLRPGLWNMWNTTANLWNNQVSFWQDTPGLSMSADVLAGNYISGGNDVLADEYIAGRVGDWFKKVGSALAKPFLAPFRGAFLGLVKLNFRGIADKLWKVWGNVEAREKVKNVWEGFGGNIDRLLSAANFDQKINDVVKTVISDAKDLTAFTKLMVNVNRVGNTTSAPSNVSDNILYYLKSQNFVPPSATFLRRTTGAMIPGIREYLYTIPEAPSTAQPGENTFDVLFNKFIIVSANENKAYYAHKEALLNPIIFAGDETGLSEAVTAATIAMAGTILAAMAGVIAKFLPSDEAAEMEAAGKEGEKAGEDNQTFLDKAADWLEAHPEVSNLANDGIDFLEDKFKDATGKDMEDIFNNNTGGNNNNNNNGNNGSGGTSAITWLLGGAAIIGGVVLLTGKKKR